MHNSNETHSLILQLLKTFCTISPVSLASWRYLSCAPLRFRFSNRKVRINNTPELSGTRQGQQMILAVHHKIAPDSSGNGAQARFKSDSSQTISQITLHVATH